MGPKKRALQKGDPPNELVDANMLPDTYRRHPRARWGLSHYLHPGPPGPDEKYLGIITPRASMDF